MANFYLHSTEHRTYSTKHACVVQHVVDANKLLVKLDPPVPGYVYNQIVDIDMLVLAPRYADSSLTPHISEWPCVVNICLPADSGNWETGPWRLLDIGELTTS